MKYVFAIIACIVLIVIYAVIGELVFGWKNGGGAIPMLLLFAVLVATWRSITKERKQEEK